VKKIHARTSDYIHVFSNSSSAYFPLKAFICLISCIQYVYQGVPNTNQKVWSTVAQIGLQISWFILCMFIAKIQLYIYQSNITWKFYTIQCADSKPYMTHKCKSVYDLLFIFISNSRVQLPWVLYLSSHQIHVSNSREFFIIFTSNSCVQLQWVLYLSSHQIRVSNSRELFIFLHIKFTCPAPVSCLFFDVKQKAEEKFSHVCNNVKFAWYKNNCSLSR
jgi:hypothetical protein